MKTIIISLFLLIFSHGSFSNNFGDTLTYEIEGKIIQKSGSIVKIEFVKSEKIPINGQSGILSKKFSSEMFGGTVSGWVSIGEMKVSSISGNTINLTLIKELSVIYENGIKKNHFVAGKEVKFTWKEPVSQ